VRQAILLLLVAAPIAAIFLWPASPAAAIGVIALSHAAVLYPTLRPNVQWLGPVMTRFQPNGKELWLTIDDGPTDDTPAILDLLDTRQVKATFFVKGRLAEERPEVVRAILQRGHTIGNHSQTHPSASFWCLLPRQIQREIDECNTVLTNLTGAPMKLFRAPVGMKNPAVHPLLARRAMTLVGWTARGFDTTTHDPEVVLHRLWPRLEPGAIVVLHQGRASSLSIIGRVVEALQNQGYAFIVPDPGRLKTNR
jgi:peptidoglycan/xylan/chitin deacetylase (PgdA/CDA1 family)